MSEYNYFYHPETDSFFKLPKKAGTAEAVYQGAVVITEAQYEAKDYPISPAAPVEPLSLAAVREFLDKPREPIVELSPETVAQLEAGMITPEKLAPAPAPAEPKKENNLFQGLQSNKPPL